MNKIIPIKALSDSYIWTIINNNRDAVFIDPGESAPVIKAIESLELNPIAILLTHHHDDHTGGVEFLKNKYHIPVFGPKNENIPCIDSPMKEHDCIEFAQLAASFTVIDVPGHTIGHIAFLYENNLFCGDTLFTGGCGRIFEGSPGQMFASIHKLSCLPLDTKIYCAHEYTLANLMFAKKIEPENLKIADRIHQTIIAINNGEACVPSTLAIELETNPFLRCKIIEVNKTAAHYSGKSLNSEVDVFTVLREWKNNF